MMKNNKIRMISLFAALLMATTVAVSGCDKNDNNPCSSHTDADGNGVCDVCGEAVTTATTTPESEPEAESETQAPPVEVSVSLLVTDQDGNAVANVLVSLAPEDGEVTTVTTDAEGKATVTLLTGTYTVTYEPPADMYLIGSDVLTVTEGMAPVALSVTDNTPNGSEERPFVVNESTTTWELPAGVAYHFTMFSGDRRTLVAENASVEIHMNGTVYTPNETGRIEVRVTDEKQSTHTTFSVVNKADGATSLTLFLESDPGAHDNPIVIEELSTPITAVVPKDKTVYYTWTATQAGEFLVTSTDAANNISLTNKTNNETTSYSNGAEKVSVTVSVGDEVSILVNALDIIDPDDQDPNNTSVTFTPIVRAPVGDDNG